MTMQPAAASFPDVELWATIYLRAALLARPELIADNVLVTASVPNPRVDRMCVVRRDGGAARGLFDHPRLAVRTWAKSEQDATDLARLVAALLWVAPVTSSPCTHVVQLTGPTPVADESAQPLRYQLFELTMRGTVLT